MHFAMPPRKTSRPPPYAARQQSGFRLPPALRNLLRRDKLRVIVIAILGFLSVYWLLGKLTGGPSDANAPKLPKVAIGSGAPVVIVTVLDPKADPGWVAKIKQNREGYAKRHGMHSLYTGGIGHVIDDVQATRPSSHTTTNTPSATHQRHGLACPPCAMP
jgi:mannan polymerase II complex MNN11 subunit